MAQWHATDPQAEMVARGVHLLLFCEAKTEEQLISTWGMRFWTSSPKCTIHTFGFEEFLLFSPMSCLSQKMIRYTLNRVFWRESSGISHQNDHNAPAWTLSCECKTHDQMHMRYCYDIDIIYFIIYSYAKKDHLTTVPFWNIFTTCSNSVDDFGKFPNHK